MRGYKKLYVESWIPPFTYAFDSMHENKQEKHCSGLDKSICGDLTIIN